MKKTLVVLALTLSSVSVFAQAQKIKCTLLTQQLVKEGLICARDVKNSSTPEGKEDFYNCFDLSEKFCFEAKKKLLIKKAAEYYVRKLELPEVACQFEIDEIFSVDYNTGNAKLKVCQAKITETYKKMMK